MWIKFLAQGNNTCSQWGSNPVLLDLESDALPLHHSARGPVNPMGSCQVRPVYQTTLLLGRLSPLGRIFCQFSARPSRWFQWNYLKNKIKKKNISKSSHCSYNWSLKFPAFKIVIPSWRTDDNERLSAMKYHAVMTRILLQASFCGVVEKYKKNIYMVTLIPRASVNENWVIIFCMVTFFVFALCIVFIVKIYNWFVQQFWLIVLGFNDMSTLVDHFVSSPRERKKRNWKDSRGDERDE